MNFDLAGYEILPAGTMYEARNSALSEIVESSAAPMRFTACDGLLVSLGDDGYYYYTEPPGFLRDGIANWPAVQQVRSVYLVKWRMCDDPKVREKIAKADQEVYRRNQDRLRITESLMVKRSEKAWIISQLKTLDDEVKQLGRILDRNELNDIWEPGLCSSEEELNELILGLRYRVNNCSPAEARRLTREIRQFEMTREKVRSNAAVRAWILEMSSEHATQGQVCDEALEQVRNKQEAAREKTKYLNGVLEVVEREIKALGDDLAEVIVKRDRAYSRIQELRKQRDDSNGFYYQNRAVLKDVRIAATNNVINLEKLALSEVENFFSLWNSNKKFRDNYKRRIQPSLDIRQLDRDGRMKGLGNMPSVPEECHINSGAEKSKAEEDGGVVIEAEEDEGVVSEAEEDEGGVVIVDKEASSEIMPENGDDIVSGMSICSGTVLIITSEKSKGDDDDVKMKLKEMRREEEIAKAKAAMERKKKLAEKNAAKAAVKAQKEAERKLKEQEKKARKKAVASTTSSEQAADGEKKPEEKSGTFARVKQGICNSRDKFWRRHRPKGSDPVLKAILKRRRSANHWFWAVTIALFLAVFTVLGYCLLLQQL